MKEMEGSTSSLQTNYFHNPQLSLVAYSQPENRILAFTSYSETGEGIHTQFETPTYLCMSEAPAQRQEDDAESPVHAANIRANE